MTDITTMFFEDCTRVFNTTRSIPQKNTGYKTFPILTTGEQLVSDDTYKHNRI
jgi:hypothetical protein